MGQQDCWKPPAVLLRHGRWRRMRLLWWACHTLHARRNHHQGLSAGHLLVGSESSHDIAHIVCTYLMSPVGLCLKAVSVQVMTHCTPSAIWGSCAGVLRSLQLGGSCTGLMRPRATARTRTA